MADATYARGRQFWSAYLKGRPHVPDSFFERFFKYHSENGGKFDDVHDVGAGLGNLSLRLAERFARVVVTEPSQKTHQDSETFIKQTASDASQFSFVNATAEDDILAPASVDAIFCCNTMHWVDINGAMAMFEKQLISGGTLFMALIGLPILTSPVAQEVWTRLLLALIPAAIAQVGGEHWSRAADIAASGYDAIAVSEAAFEPEVVRLRLNASEDMREFGKTPTSRDTTPISCIGVDDDVRHRNDKSWYFQADLQALKDMLANFATEAAGEGEDRLWAELEDVMDQGQVEGYYPVSVIMATRR